MNPHEAADALIGVIGGLYGDRVKFFRESARSPHFSNVIDESEVTLDMANNGPSALEEGAEYEAPATYRDNQTSCRYTVLRWRGSSDPTLIFHHGSGETDYVSRIRRIASRMHGPTGNIIAGSVPYNHSLKAYLCGGARLDRWVFMLAASVRLTEVLFQRLQNMGCPRIVCGGISLGGWITNLHHTYFDSCAAYVPILAGAALDHLFTETIYRKFLARSARGEAEAIRRALNFEKDFSSRDNDNVFPVMARYDQFIRFDRQSHIYRTDRMTVLNRGHTTGSIAYRELAAHLQKVVEDSPTTKG